MRCLGGSFSFQRGLEAWSPLVLGSVSPKAERSAERSEGPLTGVVGAGVLEGGDAAKRCLESPQENDRT